MTRARGGSAAEHTIAEAARILGVSVETVRRRIRTGQLEHRTDEVGRYVVRIATGATTAALSAAAGGDDAGMQRRELERLRAENALLVQAVDRLTRLLERATL